LNPAAVMSDKDPLLYGEHILPQCVEPSSFSGNL
jgi:hypothetical protein